MRYQIEGEVNGVMATKLSSVPTVTENLVHKQTEGRHRRDRRHHAAAYAHHRKSAVELLEASKAEYVKSSRVLNNKQELKHPENLCVASRDGDAISPLSNSLLDEIAVLQTEKKSDLKAELETVDANPAKLEKTVISPVKQEECRPTVPERKQKTPLNKEEFPPIRPDRGQKSPVSKEETVHFKSDRIQKTTVSKDEVPENTPTRPDRIPRCPINKDDIQINPEKRRKASHVEGSREIKLKSILKEEDCPLAKPERPPQPSKQERIPPPKPERKPKSPTSQELISQELEHSNHSKPDIPPKPYVPPKPASSRSVSNTTSVSDSNTDAFAKPRTPPKPDKFKPVPPPRPDKTPDKSVTKELAEAHTSDMSDHERPDSERKGSCSNQSSSSLNQNPKRFSSLSAGAAVTLSKNQCDGDDILKGQSPTSVRSRESKHSSHSDNFLKPLCASNILSTSVGFLVEKKHSPVPKPRTEKQLQDKPKDLPPRRQLHRSHSDLSSCRHSRTSSDFSDLSSRISRTSTEVERFFSEMGIDRTILDPMLRLHEKAHDYIDSFSSLDSQEARSVSSRISCGGNLDQVPAESEQDLLDRDTAGTSVVERNARIIKWLCNVKKAKNTSVDNSPKQNKVANL